MPPKTTRQDPKKRLKRTYVFPVVMEKDEDGYVARCLALDGCVTQGDTYEEALANIKEATELYLESLQEHGEEIPQSEMVSLTTVEVQV
jgi:predicted RNase H-like HicB family nuclease